ncbi:MAG: hypothetical protein IJ605_05920, partial [Prevotella sp.]|nr:hypothetical protein [Prevotella sp.]
NPTYFDGNAVAATWDGWTDGGGFNATNNVQLIQDEIGLAEGWARSFDIYQDIVGLPEGTYEVRVRGLFRQNTYPKDALLSQYEYAVKLGKEDALSEEAKTDLVERAFRGKFYANRDTANFQRWNFMGTDDWTEDAQSDFNYSATSNDWTFVDSLTIGSEDFEVLEYYFPADRAGAYERFKEGYYENVLYTYVGEDGKLRIGACNKEAVESDWVTFTDWRLFYRGTESIYEEGTGIHELETEGKAVVDGIYTIDGRKAEKLQKGMNIVVRDGKARKIMVK